MSNKRCVYCYEYQDMGARFDVCGLYAPTIVPAECGTCKLITDAPTIEAEPIKHGWWTTRAGEVAFWDKCSVCGSEVLNRYPHYPYCPNCGAKMDEVGE